MRAVLPFSWEMSMLRQTIGAMTINLGRTALSSIFGESMSRALRLCWTLRRERRRCMPTMWTLTTLCGWGLSRQCVRRRNSSEWGRTQEALRMEFPRLTASFLRLSRWQRQRGVSFISCHSPATTIRCVLHRFWGLLPSLFPTVNSTAVRRRPRHS